MSFDDIVKRIHFFNNLFHIGEEVKDRNIIQYYREKKNKFQLMLIEAWNDRISLEDDGTEGMLLIKIKESSQTACHIPKHIIKSRDL